ncbi:MAG TPA: hypothetical protein VK927_10175, partial [Adhaeribacter sp.]|nr:hypothetical protein [Adhaeribacter sp.]
MFEKTVQRYRNILHLRFQPTFAGMPPKALDKISPNNFFRRLLKVGLYKAGRLFPNLFVAPPQPRNLHQKIWLYVVSQNNYDALHFLQENLPETEFVAGQNKQIGRYNKKVNRLALRLKLWYTVRFFFPVFFGLYKVHG